MDNVEKVYLDAKSKEVKEARIAELRLKLNELNASRKDAFVAGASDGRDSADYQGVDQEAFRLENEIKELTSEIMNAIIVENQGVDDIVDVNDVIEIEMIYDDEDKEIETIRLVGDISDMMQEVQVTLNSPLGQAIYLHHIGEDVYYMVNNNKIMVRIVRKVVPVEEKQQSRIRRKEEK